MVMKERDEEDEREREWKDDFFFWSKEWKDDDGGKKQLKNGSGWQNKWASAQKQFSAVVNYRWVQRQLTTDALINGILCQKSNFQEIMGMFVDYQRNYGVCFRTTIDL
jgi:hypothetical protein